MNFWRGSECQRGEGLAYRSSKCYDCCDGILNNQCNKDWLESYKAAADAQAIDDQTMTDSWRNKVGKY